jgi:hypothetical protein
VLIKEPNYVKLFFPLNHLKVDYSYWSGNLSIVFYLYPDMLDEVFELKFEPRFRYYPCYASALELADLFKG